MHADKVAPWNVQQSSCISWRDHWSSASLASWIGTGFHKLLSVLPYYTTSHTKILNASICNRIAKTKRQTSPIVLYFVPLNIGVAGFISISTVNTCVTPQEARYRTESEVTRGMLSLFHIITSFVYLGPISILTIRPCHGPWTVNESERFLSSVSPTQTWSPEFQT